MAVVIASGFADGITMDAEKLNRAINRLPTVLALEMRAALLNIGAEHVKRVKQNFTTYTPGQNKGNQLQVRSGSLRNAVGPSELSGANLASLRLTQIVRRPTNGRPYAPLQELGGTVRPKKTQALTMPIGVALDPSGKLRTKFRVRRDGTWKSGKPRWVTNAKQEKVEPSTKVTMISRCSLSPAAVRSTAWAALPCFQWPLTLNVPLSSRPKRNSLAVLHSVVTSISVDAPPW